MSDLYFTSAKNYLKRASSSGSANVAAPVAPLNAWFNYVSTYTVPHGLSYIPEVRVYFDPAADGKVYPACGNRFTQYGDGLNVGDVICTWEIDATNLTIYLESASVKTGTRPVYWVIYLDY